MKKLGSVLILIGFISVFIYGLSVYNSVSAETDIERREKELRAELERIEKEQAQVQATLNQQKGQTASIQRDVDILTSQIKQAQLNIQKKNINIQQLGKDISIKDQTVQELNEKIDRNKVILSSLIRDNYQRENISLVEILLAYERLSDFFINIDESQKLQGSIDLMFEEIREFRGLTEKERGELQDRQNKERALKAEIEAEKKIIDQKEAEKQRLLSISKQTEKTYEGIIEDKKRQAAQIRQALFQLRDSQGISFGDALKYANTAGKASGVRPAFILAILKQESDLGKNVGTCNRAGDPPEKKWTAIMPGPNDGHRSYRDDQTIFLRITKNLGLDPDTTPLSCPWGNGWGGAMGPSQFIPTTWASYEAKIAAAVGVSTPNPWNPEHAFTATAIYVSELGASAGTYDAERTAALKYYAGSNWASPQNAFYGNSVMQHATTFQNQIDFLDEVEE